jgi:hypothetical protein
MPPTNTPAGLAGSNACNCVRCDGGTPIRPHDVGPARPRGGEDVGRQAVLVDVGGADADPAAEVRAQREERQQLGGADAAEPLHVRAAARPASVTMSAGTPSIDLVPGASDTNVILRHFGLTADITRPSSSLRAEEQAVRVARQFREIPRPVTRLRTVADAIQGHGDERKGRPAS